MKLKAIVVYVCIAISLVGCSSNKYKESIEKGNEYLASKEYTKAKESFRLALTEQNDKEVFKLTEQIGSIIDIQDKIKNKEYDKALDICNQVNKNGYSNDIIRKDVNKLKKDIQLSVEYSSKDVNKDKAVPNENSIKENTKEKTNDNLIKDNLNNSCTSNDAKLGLYKCLEPDYYQSDIKLIYVPSSELGDIIPNDIKVNYYVFRVEDRNYGTEWDFYYIYNKEKGTAFKMDMNGNISEIWE